MYICVYVYIYTPVIYINTNIYLCCITNYVSINYGRLQISKSEDSDEQVEITEDLSRGGVKQVIYSYHCCGNVRQSNSGTQNQEGNISLHQLGRGEKVEI